MRRELRSDFTTRQTMLSELFELYYYSDVTIKPVEMHSHDYYEFYIFLEGDIDMQIENVAESNIKLVPGDIVVFPPGVRHHAIERSGAKRKHENDQTTSSYRRFVFWISDKYLSELLKISPDYAYLIEEAREGRFIHHLEPALFGQVQSRAITVLEEISTVHYGHDAFLRIYSSELLLTLTRYVYESEHKISVPENTDMMGRLITYIDEHLTDPLSLDILAEKLFVSKSYIVHEFKNRLGLSVHQYIVKKRLAGCRDAMLSGMPISQAYITYGFNDYSNFYKAFKKEYGYSPREYVDIHTMSGITRPS